MLAVGKHYPRVEGVQKATGTYIYTQDLSLPRMLYGKFKRSRLPHARIVHIDTTKAKKINGVVAVLTGADLSYSFGIYINDEPFLARDKVRYCGEPVAAVSAISADIAAEAAEQIDVEYEELEPVLDPIKAMDKDSPLVHPDLHSYSVSPIFQAKPHTNICSFVDIQKGNIEKGLDDAYEIFEDTYWSPIVAHAPLETHVTIAQVDLSGKITLWDSTQSPFLVRRELAMSLGVPLNKIRVIVKGIGGGFGGKSYTRIEPITVALAQHSNNRPVKVELTRQEEFEITVHKEPASIHMKTGVARDGSILARKVRAVYDSGAYAEGSPLVVRNACFTAVGPYNIEHASIQGYCVYTNNLISGPMRGFGTPQLTWAYESQMDTIAAKLNMDPLEIRLKNCLQEGHELPSGEILHNVGLRQTLEHAAEKVGWKKYKARKDHGIGIACCHKLSFSPATASAFIRIDEDGSVQLDCATVEMGQGSNNTLIQIAAESLGVPFERIAISQPDTDYSPYDQSTTGSRSTFTMGNAVLLACEDIKKQLMSIASQCYGLPEDELSIEAGNIKPSGSDECGLPFEELIQRNFKPRKASLIGKGLYTSTAVLPDVKTGKTPRASAFWMYGTQIAIVKVDRETGQLDVKKVASAYDLGKAINPQGAETQIEGGVIQGLGTVLTEELVIENGQVKNPSYRDYHILTAMDSPEIVPIFVEVAHDEGPFGARGHGELVLNATAPAVANAVFNATGVRIRDLPLSQEKIFRALRRESNPKRVNNGSKN
ncbi:MAG: xanthine dehydrogenase family protein molybdopterin-binding subunit [Planctomycetota bacterium]|jgi:carbon-monoxide dehydrogenase large subunit